MGNPNSFLTRVARKVTEVITFGSIFTAAGSVIAGIAALIDPSFSAVSANAAFITAGIAGLVGGAAVITNTALTPEIKPATAAAAAGAQANGRIPAVAKAQDVELAQEHEDLTSPQIESEEEVAEKFASMIREQQASGTHIQKT